MKKERKRMPWWQKVALGAGIIGGFAGVTLLKSDPGEPSSKGNYTNPAIPGVTFVKSKRSSLEEKVLAENDGLFEEAVKNPNFRGAYVEKVVTELGIPSYVTSVRYRDEKRFDNGKSTDLLCTPLGGYYFVGNKLNPLKSEINVYQTVFGASRNVQNTADFVSLLEHELEHAELFHNGHLPIIRDLTTVNGKLHHKLWKIVHELRAYEKQIKKSLPMSNGKLTVIDLSWNTALKTLGEYKVQYEQLHSLRNDPSIQPGVIERLINTYDLPHLAMLTPNRR